MNRLLQNIYPWLVVIRAYPALMLFNGAFILLFPAPDTDPMAYFRPENARIQATYVYQNQTPHEVFGNFYYALGSQLAVRGQLPIA